MKNDLVKIDPGLLEMFAAHPEGGISPFKHEIFLQDITVAGTGYCDEIKDIFPQLKENMILRLQRDPKNEHDEMAIGIYFGETRIGWVPRKQNEVVARLMDAGKNICLRVKEFYEEEDLWRHIDCKMYLVD